MLQVFGHREESLIGKIRNGFGQTAKFLWTQIQMRGIQADRG
jgi:hypothetical protein